MVAFVSLLAIVLAAAFPPVEGTIIRIHEIRATLSLDDRRDWLVVRFSERGRLVIDSLRMASRISDPPRCGDYVLVARHQQTGRVIGVSRIVYHARKRK